MGPCAARTRVRGRRGVLTRLPSVRASACALWGHTPAHQGYRNLLAASISEALAVFAAAGITTVTSTPTPLWTLPYVLRLPDWLFNIVAVSMLSIDETARSSMVRERDRRTTTPRASCASPCSGRARLASTHIQDEVLRGVREHGAARSRSVAAARKTICASAAPPRST